MSWFTVGEIVVWLVLAGVLGIALGWLLHDVWNRRCENVDAGPVALLIKGNSSSMIFHAPGTPAYDRTTADRWFATEQEATAAGFRAPKNR